MVRPSGWEILGLDGDPTPGVVETVQALAKQFGDFAHDVESAYRSLNSFGADANALQWVGQTAEAFKGQFGPLPGRLQKLYVSYSEASDALSAYAPALQSAQSKADTALRQAQDANVDLQRAQNTATNAAADLKTAQNNHAANPNPQAVTDAQTAHDTAQTNLKNAQAHMAALTAQANQAHSDLDAAAKQCAKALHHAQSDGIHNKHWWEHVGEFLSEWGGKIAEIANDLAPFLDVLALATSWIPGVDVITAGLAEADNLIALAGTGLKIAGDTMQGHFGDALMGAGMLGLTFVGGKAISKLGGKAFESLSSKFGKEAEGAEGALGREARGANGVTKSCTGGDPVDLVSGEMVAAEIDLELPGVLPVQLRRAYASGYDTGRLFGPGWASTLDQRLAINDAGIHYAGDDGQVLSYALPKGGEEVLPERGERWPLVWDGDTDEIRISDPWSGISRHFPVAHYRDEFGQIRDLTAITDRNGNRVSILRDEYGSPTSLEHPAYRVAVDTIVTTGGPRITGLRLLGQDGEPGDSSGRGEVTVKQYQYDEHGRLVGVVNSSGLPYAYEWDDADRITAWTDRVGYRYTYEYGADGRVVRGTGDGGFLSASIEYRDEERTTVLTDSLGHETMYRYDENGHIAAVVDPLGNTEIIRTDRFGRELSRTDPLGATTTLEYDDVGDIRLIVAPDGATTALEYDDLHQITRVTAPDGAVWRREYDDVGNLTSVTDPAGARCHFDVGPQGALMAETDPLGATTRYTVDAAGLPIAVVDPDGSLTQVVRDIAGRPIRVIDPLGAVTLLEWNTEGWPVSQTGPDGATTRWEYDPEGRLLRSVNAVGAATVFEPGPFDTVAARTGPDGVRHTFTYDTEQRLLQVTNPAGASWDYTYDPANRLTSETDFNGRRLDYGYDPAGRLTARGTGTGASVFIGYDAAGRMTERQTAEGEYAYSYDVAGRLTAATGPDSTVGFEHDACGRILTETIDGRTMRYAYDAAGRRTGRTTASGVVSVWRFDSSGQPSTLEAGPSRLDFSFDAAGHETERSFGPDTRLTSMFDASGRLTAQNLVTGLGAGSPARGSVDLSRSWTWRADGVPEEIRDSVRGTRRIISDAAGRVTAVTAHNWHETYAYDAFGNVAASEIGTGGDETEPTLAHRTLVQRSARTQHEYDEAGRVIRTTRRTLDGRRKTWHYTWNSQDQLVQVETPDRTTWQYTYDPAGRRIAKHRVDVNGVVAEQTLFTWDGPRLAEQTTIQSEGTCTTLTWDYDPGTFRPAAQRSRTWVEDADQSTIDEAFHAIVTDLIGTPTELVTPDGHVAWQTTTTLWGHPTTTASDADLDCPLRFPGQYHDTETGLHYNLHRYYNPDTASYLTPDPVGLTAAPNDHAYVPNPLTWTDPFGLACEIGTQIDYNRKYDLIDATKARRLADGMTIGKGANYGAARLKNGDIITGRSGGRFHTEEDLINKAGGLHNIAEIYSERAPCAFRCQPILRDAVDSGNLVVKWSWRWNGATKEATDLIRANTNKAVKAAVNALPWP